MRPLLYSAKRPLILSRALADPWLHALQVSQSAPNTPRSHQQLIDPDLAAHLSKTALKRAVHDAKTSGLTFNQKKHRSPSHIRRSQRRQQERLASPVSLSKLASPSVGSTERREASQFVDPWEDSENVQPSSPARMAAEEGRSARQALSFEPRPQRASSLRNLR